MSRLEDKDILQGDLSTTLKRIKALRKRLHLNQCELSKKVGVSASTIDRIENGRTALKPYMIDALATALGTTRDFLLMKTDDPMLVSVESLTEPAEADPVVKAMIKPVYRMKGHYRSIEGLEDCQTLDEITNLLGYDPNADPLKPRDRNLTKKEAGLYAEFDEALANLVALTLRIVDGEFVERREVPTRIRMVLRFLQSTEQWIRNKFPGELPTDIDKKIVYALLNTMLKDSSKGNIP